MKKALKRCSHPDHEGKRFLPATFEYFSQHPMTRDGFQSICKTCNRRLARLRNQRIAKEKVIAKEKKDFREKKKEVDFIEEMNDFIEEIDPESPIGVPREW